MTEPWPIDNAGTEIGIGLRPTVAELGASFFTNTATFQGVTKTTNDLGEETLQFTTILEHIPAMMVKAELNAGREEQTAGSVEAVIVTYDVTLGGYFPEIELNMRMIEEQSGRKYDIVGIDHPAIAMTTLVVTYVDVGP